MKVNSLTSHSLTLSTGAHQGCVLSPWLFSLYTTHFTSKGSSVKTIKYTDDTTIVGTGVTAVGVGGGATPPLTDLRY